MSRDGKTLENPTIVVTARRGSLARLRRAYFAQAGELAARYRIDFDRVVEHLWAVRKSNRRFRLQFVCCVEDVIHAIACIDEIGLAWSDLAERYERTLTRRCGKNLSHIEATLMVRKLFSELRHRNRLDVFADSPSMREFSGHRPLRAWLTDRLNAFRTREALEQLHRRPLLRSQSSLANAEMVRRAGSQRIQPVAAAALKFAHPAGVIRPALSPASLAE